MQEEAAAPSGYGCLTGYLWLVIVLNALVGLFYAGSVVWKPEIMARYPQWAPYVLMVGAVLNVICAIALLRRRWWGFWGAVLLGLGVFALNLYLGVSPARAAPGLVGVLLVFLLLQLGKPRAWSMLR